MESMKKKSSEMEKIIGAKPIGNQTICPVTGKKADPKIYVDFQGSRIKFCNYACEAKFLKAPEEGFKKLAAAKEIAENIQTKCPVSEDVLENFNVFIQKPGRKIFFCCEACIPDFENDEERFLNKLPGVKSNGEEKKKK